MANKYSALLERWKFVELYFKDTLKRKILGCIRNVQLLFKKEKYSIYRVKWPNNKERKGKSFS